MAKFHYDLTGAEPIIRDIPIYDAADIAKGEFVMMDAASASTQPGFVTGYVSASAAEMVDGLGIMNETITTTSEAGIGDYISTAATTATKAISSIASTVANGSRYGKAIINPFAIYLTEYSQAAADDFALSQAMSTTTWTMTSIEQDQCASAWVYGSHASATSGFEGQLRRITSSGGDGSCVLHNAMTVAGGTSDTVIMTTPINNRLTNLDTTGTMLKSTAAVHTGVSLTVIENYIGGKYFALQPLRRQLHDNQDLGVYGAKLYADILIHDHIYNIKA
jgi:hypothetical protein